MTRVDFIDYPKNNIRLNYVYPDLTHTDMTSGTNELADRMRPGANITRLLPIDDLRANRLDYSPIPNSTLLSCFPKTTSISYMITPMLD